MEVSWHTLHATIFLHSSCCCLYARWFVQVLRVFQSLRVVWRFLDLLRAKFRWRVYHLVWVLLLLSTPFCRMGKHGDPNEYQNSSWWSYWLLLIVCFVMVSRWQSGLADVGANNKVCSHAHWHIHGFCMPAHVYVVCRSSKHCVDSRVVLPMW